MKRLVLIGCGDHSERNHAPAMAHFAKENPGRIELAGCCDLRPGRAEEFARRFGFASAWADWREILARTAPDAAVGVLPVELNAAVATELLAHGLPFCMEKPIAQSPAEARALAEAAAKSPTPHMVSLNRRFSPYLNAALDFARRQGPVRYLRGRMLRHARREAEFTWGTGIHMLDALVYAGGQVDGFDVWPLAHSELTARWCAGRLSFVGGAVGQFEMLPTCGMLEESYEFCGEGYRACFTMGGDYLRPTVKCWRDKRLEIDFSAPADEPGFITDGAYAELCHFVECLESGRHPSPTIADALHSTLLAFEIAERVM